MQNTVRQNEQLELWEVVRSPEIRPGAIPPKRISRRRYSRKQKQARRRRAIMYRCMAACILLFLVISICTLISTILNWLRQPKEKEMESIPVVQQDPVIIEEERSAVAAPNIQEDFLELNDYSRPGTELT